MSTSGDNNMNQPDKNFDNYVPSVAYTLGDVQPVRSTYIAHDPFFFMDVDDVTLDEELLKELERDFSAYDSNSYQSSEDSFLDTLIEFDTNLDYITGGEALQHVNVARALKILSQSRSAQCYLEFAAANKIEFIACPQIYNVEYNRAENIILYQPALNETEFIKGMICALRQAWQNFQGALLQPVALYPDHAVFINRAQKADVMCALLRASWELDLAGHHTLWDDLAHSSLRDLTHVFGREACMDFRSLNNGLAGFAVFESWFISDRSKSADTNLIQKMLSDYAGHQFEDEDMSQLVVVDLVKALGEMPYGKNYLSHHIPNLLTDPLFTEVRERSAANFLWFIKFEKTFTEVEQSLQNGSISQHSDSPNTSGQSLLTSHTGSYNYDLPSEQTGILLSFPTSRTRKSGDDAGEYGRKIANQGGEVIPFDISVRPFNGNFLS